MENLVFNSGVKTYRVNGDDSAVIRINTTDMNILTRLNEAQEKIKQLSEKYENAKADDTESAAKLFTECDNDIREQINYIFGSDVCTPAFGGVNCLSPAGGSTLFENFLNALVPIVRADILAEQKLSEEKIGEYTSQVNNA